jgi:hypothetical protein
MNRGNIPGYYFDEEKKKYFKIQANHKAPADAKYSKSNATRERNESKRRKVEVRQQRVLRSQTVTRSRLLDNPLIGGSGLLREQAGHLFSTIARNQSSAIAQSLKGSGVYQFTGNNENRVLCDVHQFRNHVAFTVNSGICTAIHRYEHPEGEPFSPTYKVRDATWLFALDEHLVATCSTTISGTPYILACSSGPETAKIFYSTVDVADARSAVWKVPDVVNSCKINQTTKDIAFAGSRLVAVRNILDNSKLCWITLPVNVESAGVEWVTENTVAFGSSKSVYGKRQKVTREHAVMLWDIRVNSNKSADSTSLRLSSAWRVTGIERPDDSGNNLVVTTNHSIKLHDLRVLRKDQPLLSFDHQSEGMETYTSTYNNDMLAAVDERQRVQLYSLRSGTRLNTLVNQHSGLLRNVRWFENRYGSPSLQACCGNTVQTWSQT